MKKLFWGLFILTTLTVLFVLYKDRLGPKKPPVQVNEIINDMLVQHDVTDRDIVSQYRQEHKEKDATWIETTREIKLSSKVDIDKFKTDFYDIVNKAGFEVYEFIETSRTFKVMIGKDNKILQNMLFYHSPVAIRQKKRVAIVIDDIGYQPAKMLEPFINLNVPITFSIIPREKFSKENAMYLQQHKYPYLLHQPLEPIAWPKENPGKYAIMMSTPEADYDKILSGNLRSVINPVGVNNHMGSKFTGDKKKMKVLLSLIRKKNLFFFDSMTNMKSAAKTVAKELRMPILRNEVFLDAVDDEKKVQQEYDLLLKISAKKGAGIAIGHIHKKNTVLVLQKSVKQSVTKGYEFVFLSDLLRKK
jgi:hypothetical protein